MKVHGGKSRQIMRMYREGFLVWRIAQETGLSRSMVACVLFRQGVLPGAIHQRMRRKSV